MTGPEHYETAENLLADAAALMDSEPAKARMMQAAAHTHAILAQTAALMTYPGFNVPGYEAWAAVLA